MGKWSVYLDCKHKCPAGHVRESGLSYWRALIAVRRWRREFYSSRYYIAKGEK